MTKAPEITLPEYVEPCWACDGAGEREQSYTAGCGMGYYRTTGPCDHCRPRGSRHYNGQGYVYKETGTPVPDSVLIQMGVRS